MRDDTNTGGDRAVSAAPALQDSSWDELVEVFEHLDPPEGWRAEIIDGRIVMSPPPAPKHNLIADSVQRSIYPALPRDIVLFQTAGVSAPPFPGQYVPDLIAFPRDATEGESGVIPGEAALLAMEITSKGYADTGRTRKLHAYARAAIPLYLLIDRFADRWPTVTLYSDPAEDVYRAARAVPFGKPLILPGPFDVTIETADFPR
ncbi:Uma2 family endonuclease [Saccharopolyspora sp. HNM0986]|nr:Uma2 family endonuclease [Saccharopolyspora sp. HNM0986]